MLFKWYFFKSNILMILSYIWAPFIRIQKNKYLFIGMMGKSYGGNVKAFADYVQRIDPSAKIFWAFEQNYKIEETCNKTLFGTISYYYHLFSTKYIVSDSRLYKKLLPQKKHSQIYVQMWHGTALKKIEKSAEILDDKYQKMAKNDSRNIDIFISGNGFMSKIYQQDFWFHGKVYEIGTPRNDILFEKDECKINNIRSKVKNDLGIERTKKIILYAPTFRNSTDSFKQYDIDSKLLIELLNKKFGEQYVFVTRLHPFFLSNIENVKKMQKLFPDAKDCSLYPDIQELLIAADVLVTDYSSCMFDFMLTNKICFIYAKDIDSYDRGFYMDVRLLPFPIITSNEEIENIVCNFDYNLYQKGVDSFARRIENFEDGSASKKLYDLIRKDAEKPC